MKQHLASRSKKHLKEMRVIFDDKFNKSAALDLESRLIQLLFGNGNFKVLNMNTGITDAEYFDRSEYQNTFNEVFRELRSQGIFTHSIPQIINSDLFKFSPFKELNNEQAIAVDGVLHALFEDVESRRPRQMVMEGGPGTGKTIVAIYLMKLLTDIANTRDDTELNNDSIFSDFFVRGYREHMTNFTIGLVVPQQSLRASIKKVFAKTPGLTTRMVLTPFDVGASKEKFDLLIVDETHRLNQRANQASGTQNKKFGEINTSLFGSDDYNKTQLDWIRAQSRHQLFLVDEEQSVRPADITAPTLRALVKNAKTNKRYYHLPSQMRVRAGANYVSYIRGLFTLEPPVPRCFEGYELAFFDNLAEMHSVIREKNLEYGLARLISGYAWPWKSKKKTGATEQQRSYDIEVDGYRLRWNSTQTDWINSPGSVEEVGSIHTVQGYDLNYAGVIIGPDLRYDPAAGKLVFDRENYHDKKGKENNPKRGIIYTDEDLLRFVSNIYGVLLTRGIRGTYVYVCDPHLREYLRAFISV